MNIFRHPTLAEQVTKLHQGVLEALVQAALDLAHAEARLGMLQEQRRILDSEVAALNTARESQL